MDRERISNLIAELDQLVPSEDANVLLAQYGGGPDESKFMATEVGYLRFGLEFMKGAFLPKANDKTSDMVQMNLEHLISNESTISFDCFERVETLKQPSKPLPSTKLIGWVLAVIGGLLVVMVVIGAVTTIRWFLQ